jgi:uncharacterized membrane protein (DUF106 family)
MILIKNAFQLIIYQYNIILDFFYHYHIKIFKNHLKTYQFNIFFYIKNTWKKIKFIPDLECV